MNSCARYANSLFTPHTPAVLNTSYARLWTTWLSLFIHRNKWLLLHVMILNKISPDRRSFQINLRSSNQRCIRLLIQKENKLISTLQFFLFIFIADYGKSLTSWVFVPVDVISFLFLLHVFSEPWAYWHMEVMPESFTSFQIIKEWVSRHTCVCVYSFVPFASCAAKKRVWWIYPRQAVRYVISVSYTRRSEHVTTGRTYRDYKKPSLS